MLSIQRAKHILCAVTHHLINYTQRMTSCFCLSLGDIALPLFHSIDWSMQGALHAWGPFGEAVWRPGCTYGQKAVTPPLWPSPLLSHELWLYAVWGQFQKAGITFGWCHWCYSHYFMLAIWQDNSCVTFVKPAPKPYVNCCLWNGKG